MSWQYFNDTGIVGGTANMADQTFYIDAYKGSDLNVGSNAAPFQTIQKGLDSATQGTGLLLGADFILAGYFEEGDWNSSIEAGSFIAEGRVVINGVNHQTFQPIQYQRTFRNFSINENKFNTKLRRHYGRLEIKNYTNGVVYGNTNTVLDANAISRIFDCDFTDCTKVGKENIANGIDVGLCAYVMLEGCVFKNITDMFLSNRTSGANSTSTQNNTFINCNLVYFNGSYHSTRNCYFDQPTKIGMILTTLTVSGSFSNCHVEGTVTGKIALGASSWDNNELVPYTEWNLNGRLSTDATEFNALTAGDYTYPSTAINATAGFGGTYIGAYKVAENAQNVDNVNWVKTNISILGAGASSVASLTTPGTGTLETTSGIQIHATEDIWVGKIVLPGISNDYNNGQTTDTTKSADASAPQRLTIQIKVSTDNVTYSAAWIEVPYDAIPYVDGSGVGSGDAAFVDATKTRITARYIKYLITLRDDEVTIP